ncbi:MAG: hypothetical protein IKF90_06820 [Parasporobacterium sp.]|nr:hypothetical protein [Parasporobacterium sp.]
MKVQLFFQDAAIVVAGKIRRMYCAEDNTTDDQRVILILLNGLFVNVTGYNAQNNEDLADTVVHRINEMLNEDDKM